MKIKITAALLLLPCLVFAEFKEPPGYNGSSGSSSNNKMSLEYPMDTSFNVRTMPPQLQKNHYEMNIDQEDVEDVYTKRDRYKKLIDGTYGVNIMQEVDYRMLKSMDDIELLNDYTTIITFPKKYTIKSAIPSVELKENRTSQNVLFLQGKKDFTEGNIAVSLTDGKRNVLITLLLNRFIKNNNRKNNIFIPLVNYVEVPHISSYKLLKVYFKKYGIERIKYFSKNGKYDIIQYKKVPFYIIRDDKFGSIEYKDINFRIANKI